MLKNKILYLFLVFVLLLSGCSDDVASNNGSNNLNINNKDISKTDKDTKKDDNLDTNSSLWRVENTLYSGDITKEFVINGNRCILTQDSSGISYSCEGNLSSSASYTYDDLAKVLTPYLYKNNFNSTSKEILIAESNVSKGSSTFYYPPIIYKGYMYGNFGGSYEKVGGTNGASNSAYFHHYEINEYNLSRFDHDMVLEDLISNNIYSKDREYFPFFSESVSSIMELNGYLYYNVYPSYTQWDNFISYKYENHKYDIKNKKHIYKSTGSPKYRFDKSDFCNTIEYNNNVSITYGWMVPASGTKIAFLSGERMTQIDSCSGKDAQVTEGLDNILYPYAKYCTYSIKVDQREKDILNLSRMAVSNEFTYFSINGNELSATAFERQNKTRFGHSNVDKSVNVLDDFIAKYGNSSSYTYLQLQDEAVLDGDDIYLLGVFNHGSDDGGPLFAYSDLYVLKYGIDLVLKDAQLILKGGSKKTAPPEAKRFYKYKDNIYFKYKNDVYPEFYSYNLNEKKIDYSYSLKGSLRFGYDQSLDYDYAITGDTIVLPQNMKSIKDGYDYDIVFTILDIKSGAVLKTIKSERFQIKDIQDDIYVTLGSYVYANSVYFIFENSYIGYGDHYTRNILVKLNSPKNKTKVTRFRGDNRQSGLIRNIYVESTLEPKSANEHLMIDIYRYLNNANSDIVDLNNSLIKTISIEKGVSSNLLFNSKNTQNLSEYNISNIDLNISLVEEYNQTQALYNTELLTNTQTFYIPLLKKVAYSSSGEDNIDDLGEARMHINAQYSCDKSYFRFPYKGSFKLFGFDLLDEDKEFNPIPESLSLYADTPMLVVDYNTLLENQTLLRYGVDAVEFDSLNTLETITATLKKTLDSIVSTGISIVTGNYAAAVCSSANIITTYAVDSMGAGDTYYGSAMRIYTANSNFGIENNNSFSEDILEGSAKSFKIDASSAGDIVENICAGVALDPIKVVSFLTKADYDEKHIKVNVLPTWHRGIEIKHLSLEVLDANFTKVPLKELTPWRKVHRFNAQGQVATLGSKNLAYKNIHDQFKPFMQRKDIDIEAVSSQYNGWGDKLKGVLFESNYIKSGTDTNDSVAGTYLEMTLYSDDEQMGIFSDTLFLDEAIFTDNFTKDGKTYSKVVTKPFYFPDGTPQMKRVINGSITYKVSFTVY